MTSRNKTLIYKVARFNSESEGLTLQSALKQLQSKKPKASDRNMEVEQGRFRVANYLGVHKNMEVGELFDYVPGHRQPQADIKEGATEYHVHSLAPTQKGREFLDSIMFFGVLDNHVILAQTMSMKAAQFESYINHIMRVSSIFAEGQFVSMDDCPPLDARVRLKNTKSVEFTRPVELETSMAGQSKDHQPLQAVTDTKSITIKPKGMVWQVLKQFLPDNVRLPEGLSMDEIVQDKSLEVSMRLKWSHLSSKAPTALLDEISNQLRHVDEELDYRIETRSGSITKEQMKLKAVVSVEERAEGLLSRESMWRRIYEWLQQLKQEGRITGDQE